MSDTNFSIRLADTGADYEGFGGVCRLYVDWCRERYRDMPWFVEEVFGYQSLEDELKVLAEKYGPPNGRTTHLHDASLFWHQASMRTFGSRSH